LQKNESAVIAIGIACTGKFIMSAEVNNKIVIFDIKGKNSVNIFVFLF
jgi:hypothetical protein